MSELTFNRSLFLYYIKQDLGKPFIPGSYSEGRDCFSLIWCALKLVIKDLPRPENHVYEDSSLIQPFFDKYLKQLNPEVKPLPGQILLLKFDNSYHCGVITKLEPLTIIHASQNFDKIVEQRITRAWLNKFVARY